MTAPAPDAPRTLSQRTRAHALGVASALFYANGVRAVGMEEIVEKSGIAKTTIYRHFQTKDALVEAFLNKEDDEFWSQWDEVVGAAEAPYAQLDALCAWIGDRVRRDHYRGCPQLNAAAEFADPGHPARRVARRHKQEMHHRLQQLCAAAGVDDEQATAMQISLLFDGAFASDGRLTDYDAGALLRGAVHLLLGPGDPLYSC